MKMIAGLMLMLLALWGGSYCFALVRYTWADFPIWVTAMGVFVVGLAFFAKGFIAVVERDS